MWGLVLLVFVLNPGLFHIVVGTLRKSRVSGNPTRPRSLRPTLKIVFDISNTGAGFTGGKELLKGIIC